MKRVLLAVLAFPLAFVLAFAVGAPPSAEGGALAPAVLAAGWLLFGGAR